MNVIVIVRSGLRNIRIKNETGQWWSSAAEFSRYTVDVRRDDFAAIDFAAPGR